MTMSNLQNQADSFGSTVDSICTVRKTLLHGIWLSHIYQTVMTVMSNVKDSWHRSFTGKQHIACKLVMLRDYSAASHGGSAAGDITNIGEHRSIKMNGMCAPRLTSS